MNDLTLDDRESDFKLIRGQNPDEPVENVIFRPNHQWMAKPKLRERDMQPMQIYFYRNINFDPPVTVVYDEQEAAFMEKSSWKHILRPIGRSNGSAYTKVIRECGVKPGSIIPREQAIKILKDAFEAEVAQAKKNGYVPPQDQNVHFDKSFPLEQRPSYVPPK